MKATKITHRNEIRIRVDFPYSSELVSKLRQIADARWSKTRGAWHIPYTKEAFAKLKELFPDVEYSLNADETIVLADAIKPVTVNADAVIKKSIETDENKLVADIQTENIPEVTPAIAKRFDKQLNSKHYDSSAINIDITAKHIFIKMPKIEADIQYIRSYKYFKWDTINFCWVVPNYQDNVVRIKAYFESRHPQITEHISAVEKNRYSTPTFTKNELLVVNYSNRSLKIFLSFNKNIISEIRKIPLSSWNNDENCWVLPYSEKYVGELKQIAHQSSLDFIYHVEQRTKVKARTSRHDIENYRECPPEYIAKLKELRYSINTLDTYKHMFEEFINHFPETEIDAITDGMIVDFLRYLVNERNISGSYQNQSINAIHPVGF